MIGANGGTPVSDVDVVGVGVGPANLSLAALLRPVPGVSSLFFERRARFAWHPGLLLPGASTQVHFLKDLVTPVDPTSPFSFLAFLVAHKRLYRAIITGRSRVTRHEFDEYYRWVASQLPNVAFARSVDGVRWDGRDFVVDAGGESVRCRNVVLATGLVPNVPECARPFVGDRVFHVGEFLLRERSLEGRAVAIVGGGQSGAEIFHHLLSLESGRPRFILWVTKRANFLPLDDSPFTNELFLPTYSRFFFGLTEEQRAQRVEEQKLSSDGISMELLVSIYRRLYDLECIEGSQRFCRLAVAHHLERMSRVGDALRMTFRNLETGGEATVTVDDAILATGYRSEHPAVLGPLLERVHVRNGRLVIRPDFSLEWDGPPDRRIYVQNAARHHFGVADPNLSLLAWRSATIVNSLAGEQVYDVDSASGALDWGPLLEPAQLPPDVEADAPGSLDAIGLGVQP